MRVIARKCKCNASGEYGTSDTFIKIDGKYYKNQEVYDAFQEKKDLRTRVIETILYECLDYTPGQQANTIIFKKLKELDFYDDEVILETIQENLDTIKYWMQNKNFSNEAGRIAYVFAIIRNNINDVYKKFKRKKLSEIKQDSTHIEQDTDFSKIKTTATGKDISQWLEEDDVI